jgi:hypothetical protein
MRTLLAVLLIGFWFALSLQNQNDPFDDKLNRYDNIYSKEEQKPKETKPHASSGRSPHDPSSGQSPDNQDEPGYYDPLSPPPSLPHESCCPSMDIKSYSLSGFKITGDKLKCCYPKKLSDKCNTQWYCLYSKSTNQLLDDNDDDLCPKYASCKPNPPTPPNPPSSTCICSPKVECNCNEKDESSCLKWCFDILCDKQCDRHYPSEGCKKCLNDCGRTCDKNGKKVNIINVNQTCEQGSVDADTSLNITEICENHPNITQICAPMLALTIGNIMQTCQQVQNLIQNQSSDSTLNITEICTPLIDQACNNTNNNNNINNINNQSMSNYHSMNLQLSAQVSCLIACTVIARSEIPNCILQPTAQQIIICISAVPAQLRGCVEICINQVVS